MVYEKVVGPNTSVILPQSLIGPRGGGLQACSMLTSGRGGTPVDSVLPSCGEGAPPAGATPSKVSLFKHDPHNLVKGKWCALAAPHNPQ